MSTPAPHTFSVTFPDPSDGITQGLSMSGLEYMQALARGDIVIPIAALMQMSPHEVAVGRIVFKSQPGIQYGNPLGTIHGGYHATLLDSAMSCAVHTTLDAGVGYTTLQINIHYLRAIAYTVPVVYCEGKVIHSGRKIATAEGRLMDDSGKVFAHGTTTCAIFS